MAVQKSRVSRCRTHNKFMVRVLKKSLSFKYNFFILNFIKKYSKVVSSDINVKFLTKYSDLLFSLRDRKRKIDSHEYLALTPFQLKYTHYDKTKAISYVEKIWNIRHIQRTVAIIKRYKKKISIRKRTYKWRYNMFMLYVLSYYISVKNYSFFWIYFTSYSFL